MQLASDGAAQEGRPQDLNQACKQSGNRKASNCKLFEKQGLRPPGYQRSSLEDHRSGLSMSCGTARHSGLQGNVDVKASKEVWINNSRS